jgi:hypothetical protein
VRASNSIGYFLPPNLGGFYGQVMYALHENVSFSKGRFTPPDSATSKSRAGRYVGGRFGYANGPSGRRSFAYGQQHRGRLGQP